MSEKRQELLQVLSSYLRETLTYITTVRKFCSSFSEWKNQRERERKKMMDIKERDDKINLTLSHVKQSEKRRRALAEYMKSKFQLKADKKRAKLKDELTEVLRETLGGLEELNSFLDAVEKLAVSSLNVFTKNQLLPEEGISFRDVQAVISTSRQICPLLLLFKRDAKDFFNPRLQNVEVLEYTLEIYTDLTSGISEKLHETLKTTEEETSAESRAAFRENNIQSMIDHITQLEKIRMDEDFRTAFLFQKVSCSTFTKEFSERKPKMLESLEELEQCAAKLDKMSKGAKISKVTSSSLGVLGGVLSVAGLALSPLTAGASLSLTLAGVAVGVTNGANSLVTTATKIGVMHKHTKKAKKVFDECRENVESIQKCLDEATCQREANVESTEINVVLKSVKIAAKIVTIGRGIDTLVDVAATLKPGLKTAGRIVGQEGEALPNFTRGILAASKGVTAGLITVSVFFIGLDVLFITKDSINLAKGIETKVSKLIRARVALWHTEINSWQKIYDSLCKSKLTEDGNRRILEKPFYLGEN